MKKLLLLSIVAALASPSFAFAGSDEEKKVTVVVKRKQDRRRPDVEKFDTNKDGILQPEEIEEGNKNKFEELDIDKDGVISAQEQEQAVLGFKEEKGDLYNRQTDLYAKKLGKNLGKIDSDGDGTISSEEYQLYSQERYKNMDKDEDGTLDIKEFRTDTEFVPER